VFASTAPIRGVNSEMTKADLAAGTQLPPSGSANEVLLPASYLATLGFDNSEEAIGETITLGVADYTGAMHEVTATVAGVQNLTLLGVGVRLSRALTDELAAIQASGSPTGSAPATSWPPPASTPPPPQTSSPPSRRTWPTRATPPRPSPTRSAYSRPSSPASSACSTASPASP